MRADLGQTAWSFGEYARDFGNIAGVHVIRGLGDEKKKKAKQLAELKKYVLRTVECTE
jgi:hypothetical protein